MSERADLKGLLLEIDRWIQDPKKGLPQELFFFISRLTPLVSLDLLIKNEIGETFLTWRQDEFYLGWHVPGGIVRFKEVFKDRIAAIAQSEFGAKVEFNSTPLALNEKITNTRDIRGHFVALLYECKLVSAPTEAMRCKDPSKPLPNQWMWHGRCPENLLAQHQVYRKFIDP